MLAHELARLLARLVELAEILYRQLILPEIPFSSGSLPTA